MSASHRVAAYLGCVITTPVSHTDEVQTQWRSAWAPAILQDRRSRWRLSRPSRPLSPYADALCPARDTPAAVPRIGRNGGADEETCDRV
jgi:hypothetical protein